MRQLLVCGAVLAVCAGQASASARDFFTEFVKDFGTTPRGPALTHYFQVKNTSTQPVTLGTARVSCGCVSANVLKNQLAPGETTAVVAVMDTRRIPQAGVTKTVTVYVPFLSPVLEEVELKVQAIARDDLVISPEGLAFGTVKKGKGGTATVKLTLYNFGGWQVSEPQSTGQYVSAEVKQVNRQPAEVTYELTATLKDDCPAGNWTADVWVKTNAPGVERLRVPVTVNVVASITANPEAVSIASAKVGETTEHRVLLTGASPFKIVEIKGTDDEVRIKTASDEARPVHILTVAVKPKAAGTIARSFEILTDSKEQPKVTVSLKATAN
jgi:hypothetical protein